MEMSGSETDKGVVKEQVLSELETEPEPKLSIHPSMY